MEPDARISQGGRHKREPVTKKGMGEVGGGKWADGRTEDIEWKEIG